MDDTLDYFYGVLPNNTKLLKNSNYGYIMFAGGEPAMMRDFEEIIELWLCRVLLKLVHVIPYLCLEFSMQNLVVLKLPQYMNL